MKGFRMCWNLAIFQLLLISLALSYTSEARNVKHLNPSAVIVGKVYCDTCFQDDFSRSSHFISGATVSIECKDAAFKTEAKTDQQGKFKVHLPLSISKHEKEIKDCQVTLIKSNDPYCAIASTATSSSIHLKSRKQGIRVFSAGFFTFKPLKQPDLCNQQPRSTKINTQMNLLDPPTQTKAITRQGLVEDSIARPQFLFPPVVPPVFPTPPPAIGGIPLPPNPLQPSPLVPLPPNPLQPPSPPSGLPGIPGLPGLTPSPPPPSPVLPIPPGLPIPPVVPGVPRLPIPPGLPVPPVIPGVPSLPIPPAVPELPILPVVPGVPAVPAVPAIPGVPSLPIPPAVPGLPILPVVPRVPAVPGVPGLPILPVVPGVPGLPLPPGLPIPPVIPGVTPAKKVSP